MVKLTQIDDETAKDFFGKDEKANKSTGTGAEESENESELDSDEDDYDEDDLANETIYDRVVALKEIIPPQHRLRFTSASSSVISATGLLLSKTGSLLWALTSSALLLGVPLSLSILSEQQLIEMEKEMKLQQSSQEVLAPGSDTAFQKPEQPAV
ncbi:hypothetical protein PACTADRAFT_49124, partial [Pachysolen tannophilus NRRL Y-2460]